MEDKEIKQIQLCTNDTILELIRNQKELLINYKKIMVTLIVAITIIITALCGTTLYLLKNAEVTTTETTTTTTQETDGESSIINGGQYNDNAVDNSERGE